ncbi:hypothetical protein VPARA_11530 [Variovorax paradoxus]|uniref:Uncharacterized protein n=2 Tax=Variovorax paradoxus TaxID=34073 RepID=A0A0H2MLH9_VARPD|nr:hypothetical protein VPARA_11530 [Variovorax paradoxus]
MRRRPSWFVGAALIALGQHRAGDTTTPFSAADLARWVPAYPKPSTPMLAIKVLTTHEYVTQVPLTGFPPPCIRPVNYWLLTPAGAEAAKAALQSDRALHPAAYGANTPQAAVDPFALRVWSLLRIRKALTADEAASLLSDAGDDIPATRSQIGALLLAWSRSAPKAVQISAKRVNGFKRYVLLIDLGSSPPAAPAKKGFKA